MSTLCFTTLEQAQVEGREEMKKSYVWFKHGISKPVLEMKEKPDQIIVRFIPFGDEHFTIHRGYFECYQRSGLLLTHSSSNKPHDWKDESYVRIAKEKQWREPEKHGNYMTQHFVEQLTNEGYYLLGRLIPLDSYEPKLKYMKYSGKEIIVPYSTVMVVMFLSISENPCDGQLPRVKTALGDLCFRFEEPVRVQEVTSRVSST